LSWTEISARALRFSRRWRTATREKADEQPFVIELLEVFGIDDPVMVGERQKELKQKTGYVKWIDYYWQGYIAIEMKSRGEDLNAAYEQLRDYMEMLPSEEVPALWLICDFENFHVYNYTAKVIYRFKLADLRDHVRRFAILADYEPAHIRAEQLALNVKAAEKMAKLHDALKALGYSGHGLEVYMVRLLFCMFADDTNIFPKDSFYQYISASQENGDDLPFRLERLFQVLNMPESERVNQPWLTDELKQFQYINGKLFEERLHLANFDKKMRQTLLECIDFDWSTISPAIFGAMFQGVMDDDLRRHLGAHYTSEENIEKLIRTLFLDDLRAEFEQVKSSPNALAQFHEKLSKLKFLDPACGCGNFLIITYRELRELEHEVLDIRQRTGQLELDIRDLLKVSVEQFYGIEIEDFPAQIAQVGMWLMDHQMNLKAEKLFGQYYARLPLVQTATIVQGNALRMDWEQVVPKAELSFILGNPPFVGHQWRSEDHQTDMKIVFGGITGYGKLDYVCSWYQKSFDYMKGTTIKAALVSTNSIVQGESVATMWKPAFEQGFEITFAYHSFIWTSEARGKAAVYVVIIGFASIGVITKKKLFTLGGVISANNINGYLMPGPNIFIQSRGQPFVAGMPKMSKGSQPTDGGQLLLTSDEKDALIREFPRSSVWIKRFMSGEDFINNNIRFCLWLKDAAPADYRGIKLIMNRLERVSQSRRNSPTASVRRDADTPMLFTQIRQPETRYLAIPEVSSERRRYIPIGYVEPDVIASNQLYIVAEASLYMFGVLTSNVHMAWMRVVAGRLKQDYRYSPAVYNNFPWPMATETQIAHVEKLAQSVIDARNLYQNNSLADLYDALTMPPELTKAHRDLDRAVMRLYGFTVGDMDEAECVAELMKRYQELTQKRGEKHGEG